MCEQKGVVKVATIVDHIKPWKEGRTPEEQYGLFWDRENWQPLCASHHNKVKQMQEIHGFSSECGLDGMPTDPNHPFWGKG